MRYYNNHPNTCVVAWEITNICNYNCWYCPDHLHASTTTWPDFKTCVKFFTDLAMVHENIVITLLGGEPALWPDLANFIKAVPDNVEVDLVTNGSQPISWWHDMKSYLGRIVISCHPEYVNIEHVKSIIDEIHADVDLYIFILYDPNYHQTITQLQELFKFKNINHNLKPIFPNFAGKMLNYTTAEKAFIKNSKFIAVDQEPISSKKPVVLYHELANGVSREEKFTEILVNNNNAFTGWKCMAGNKRLHITENLDIFSCSNRTKYLGNLLSGFTLIHDYITCSSVSCTCPDDLRTEKWQLQNKDQHE